MAIVMILICAEGKETEEAFLTQVIDAFHINANIVKFRSKKGAHKTIINNCVKQRKALSIEKEIEEEEIETWAMFDRDRFKGRYSNLETYAAQHNVKIAFSSPQFESFILQMFVFSKKKLKGDELEKELGEHLKKTRLRDGNILAEGYSKSDLSWVGKLLDEKPSMLTAAIRNAKKLDNQAKDPFFTVQDLVERIKNLN